MPSAEKLPRLFGNISLSTTRRCMEACREAGLSTRLLCRIDARNVVALIPGNPYRLLYMRHFDGQRSRMEWTINPAVFRRDLRRRAELVLSSYMAMEEPVDLDSAE